VPGRSRWIPVWFLFFGGMVNYMDRSAVSVAAPLLMRDLGLNAAQLGIIFSSFFAGYAVFTFIGGYASDVLGPKRVFTLAMTTWSTFCGLTAAATGFTSLLIVRVVFGCGEGPFSASANKMVSNWFGRREAATAIGVANAGTPIGGALAGPIAGTIALRYGWRMSFVVLAMAGFIWTLLWMINVSDGAAEARDGRDGIRRTATTSLGVQLRQPIVIATGASFFAYAYILYLFLTWFPTYLTMAKHMAVRDMVFMNTIPWVLGTVGLAASGMVSDFLSRATGDVLRARKLVLLFGLSVATVCVTLTGLVPSVGWAVALMTGTIFSVYLTGATYWAIILEAVQPEHVGAAGGFVHLIANCAGIIGPAVTGFIVQATGVFTSAFMVAGGVGLAGVVLVAVFVRRSST
jgi:ACS family hexuronate transporter-like MFS transporter